MLTWRFAVHLNRSLVGLLGIVIEKTDVAYLRSFPCVVVKKTFQVTCGDPETEVDLIMSRAGISRRQKISMILQFAQLIDRISLPRRCMTIVTHVNSKMNQPPNCREMGFFPSLHIYKNLPRTTLFRKLKCPDPSMIPLPAEVKECSQKSIRLTSYIVI